MSSVTDVVDIALRGDVERVRTWLASYRGRRKEMEEALIAAVKAGHADVVEVLIQEGHISANTRDVRESVR